MPGERKGKKGTTTSQNRASPRKGGSIGEWN